MVTCPNCGSYPRRVRRNMWARLVYRSLRICSDCGFRLRKLRWSLSPPRFVFSTWSSCPRCGTRQVKPAIKRDRIDDISKHPLSLLLQIFGAPRLRCSFCRLEYHDIRPTRGTKGPELPSRRSENPKRDEKESARFPSRAT